MATRKLRLRKTPVKERRNNGEFTAGGTTQTLGYTRELKLSLQQDNLFGLFSTGKKVIELDYRDNQSMRVIEPVFRYKDLIKIYLQSTILRQCVEAYQINIDSYGHTFEYIGPEGQMNSRAAKNELARLTRVVDNLTTDDRPMRAHREASRIDKEVFGARAFEVSHDLIGRCAVFNHVQVATLRMTTREKAPIMIDMIDPVTGATRKVARRFRRFLQITDEGEKVWFKEYGDPRSISPVTGLEDSTLSVEDQATEIYYEGNYTPGTPYGTPRWAGVIPALLGSREAEMVNLNFFRDNAIPALAVLVSGGALTEESFDKIEQYIAGVRGQKSMNRIVVLEATASGSDLAAIEGTQAAPKVDIKPMLSERQHEGLFGNYITSAEERARSTFRLPPIYVGMAKDYNRASAFASILTADQQIFVPERNSWDTMFHHIVMSTHNPKYWRYKSAAPQLSDTTEVARMVTTLAKEGAMTPNIAIKLANRYLDANIEPINEEWGDTPFAVVQSYINSGRTLKGLDIFTDKLEETATNPGDDEDDPEKDDDPVQAIKFALRAMFDDFSDDLRQEIAFAQHEAAL